MRIVRKVGGMSAVFYAANRPLSDGVDIAYNIVALGRGGASLARLPQGGRPRGPSATLTDAEPTPRVIFARGVNSDVRLAGPTPSRVAIATRTAGKSRSTVAIDVDVLRVAATLPATTV